MNWEKHAEDDGDFVYQVFGVKHDVLLATTTTTTIPVTTTSSITNIKETFINTVDLNICQTVEFIRVEEESHEFISTNNKCKYFLTFSFMPLLLSVFFKSIISFLGQNVNRGGQKSHPCKKEHGRAQIIIEFF